MRNKFHITLRDDAHYARMVFAAIAAALGAEFRERNSILYVTNPIQLFERRNTNGKKIIYF